MAARQGEDDFDTSWYASCLPFSSNGDRSYSILGKHNGWKNNVKGFKNYYTIKFLQGNKFRITDKT